MHRSCITPAPGAPAAATRSHERHDDADVYGGCLRDVRQQLLEPPEFMLRSELLQPDGAGRDRPIHDGPVIWF
jgi:hypothetical protein